MVQGYTSDKITIVELPLPMVPFGVGPQGHQVEKQKQFRPSTYASKVVSCQLNPCIDAVIFLVCRIQQTKKPIQFSKDSGPHRCHAFTRTSVSLLEMKS